jgi:tetratricopeptide (TPR) repeat protein/predicted Ser/Thr protein kinase
MAEQPTAPSESSGARESDRERRLGEVLAGYFAAVEAGRELSPQELIARHPELASELEGFFADQEQLGRLVAPLRPVAKAATAEVPTLTGVEARTPPPQFRHSAPAATLSLDEARGPILYPAITSEQSGWPGPAADDDADAMADGDPPRGITVRYFGDYELKRVLGKGGMGVVYQAKQLSLNRLVALKMLRAGIWAGDDEVHRFQNEAEAVANLDHPQIVTIYEVGQYDGRHYFSMRLVEGPSLEKVLDQYAADPRRAARLVSEVARALHHAHQRGILHRDLKPSNILLDGEARPHVTDFGLAKQLERNGALSISGSILGTPQYMSPEQASGSRRAITTVTDVYGLGALLYAALTGRPPFKSDSVLETLDQVRECAAQPPSRVNRKVSRDLEVICLKCLEKDPRRRYDSAAALADDLERYQRGEPIQARRTGPIERVVKWTRRRPAIAALVGAVLLSTLIGIAGVAMQWRRAEHLRTRAEANFDLARGAVDDYLTIVSQNRLLKSELPGLQPLRKELLEKALGYYQEFLKQRGDDAAQREATAGAFYRVGDITGEIGSKAAALEALGRAISLYEELRRSHPRKSTYSFGLARCYRRTADIQQSVGPPGQAAMSYKQAVSIGEALRQVHPENAEFLGELALSYREAGLLQQAIEVGEKLAHDHPAVPEYQDDLARSYFLLGIEHEFAGRLEQSMKYANLAYAIRERLAGEHPANPYFQSGLAGSLANLSRLHEYSGRPGEALRLYEQCFKIISRAARDNPDVKVLQARLAGSNAVLAHLLHDNGRNTEAIEPARQAVAAMEQVARERSANWEIQLFLVWSYIELGKSRLGQGQAGQAMESFRKAMAILEKPPQLIDDPLVQNLTHFHRARVWALQSSAVGAGKTKLTEADAAQKRVYSDRAMEALKQTFAGYTYPGMLKFENEFDVLRPREDFQSLVREQEERLKAIR